jgi:hypothetical protein
MYKPLLLGKSPNWSSRFLLIQLGLGEKGPVVETQHCQLKQQLENLLAFPSAEDKG